MRARLLRARFLRTRFCGVALLGQNESDSICSDPGQHY
jgi:hypothetical protein